MTIVITQPHFFDGEAQQIAALLHRDDVNVIHIRKPEATREATERLIRQIPQELHSRLVLHDHYALAQQYGLYGIHLNSRNTQPPHGWQGSVSRSCHTLSEVEHWKPLCNYVSLSPIFDSISKQGYRSAFTIEELRDAHRRGIIDDKVYALGGITFSNIPQVLSLGFGGAMILGDAWNNHA